MSHAHLYRILVPEAALHRRTERDEFPTPEAAARARAANFLREAAVQPGLQRPHLVSSFEGSLDELLFAFPRYGVADPALSAAYKSLIRELRNGRTEDGKTQVKSPSATLSTAEAISVINNGMALAGHFGDGVLRPHDMASGLIGAVVKDPVQDQVVWSEYLETVVKERQDWKDLYRAFRDLG